MGQYYDEGQAALSRAESSYLETSEPKVDGAWVCADCEEVIPGDDKCYDVNGEHYCESCMECRSLSAPYSEDLDPRNDERPDLQDRD